jgi:hypothetical protein
LDNVRPNSSAPSIGDIFTPIKIFTLASLPATANPTTLEEYYFSDASVIFDPELERRTSQDLITYKIKPGLLQSDFKNQLESGFLNSPFVSINSEIIAEVANKKFVTLSGVGRIGAIKIVFPTGLRIKIIVGNLDAFLKKRLIALNNMFIYSNRFSNLKKYGINEKEIIDSKRIVTKKCYKRGKFIKRQSRKLLNKIIPLK